MSITIHCDCGKSFSLADEYAGKRVRCTACKAVLEVPGPGPGERRHRDDAVAPDRPSRRPRAHEDDAPRDRPRRPRGFEDDEPRPRRRHRKQGGAMWLIIGGVCLLLLLVGGAITAIVLTSGGSEPSPGSRERGHSERMTGANNLKQMALAMHAYHDVFRQLPSLSGNPQRHPGLSWRVDLLPFLEQENLYHQIRKNEPYDSPHNRQFWSQMPEVYAAPGTDPSTGKTPYQIFAGPSTPLAGPRPTFNAVIDGTSNTILIVEAATEVNWMAPEDIRFQPAPGGFPAASLGPPHDSSFLAVLCDGTTRDYPKTIDPMTMQHLIMSNDGNIINLP